MGADVALAVDIGGTKLAAAVIDRAGAVQWRSEVPTPRPTSPPRDPVAGDPVWAALDGLLGRLPAGARPVVCGVGCGGPMAPGGELVSPLNIPGWRDFPLRARLAERTGCPTWVDNDAKALALAEGWRGRARGCPAYLSMVVSTGVGAGLVVDGRLLDGRTGNAGHLGHLIVVPDGRRCACGARGCLEAEASGTAIAAYTGRPAAGASPWVVERTGRLVGRAVGSVANLLDLRLATVAGSVALGFNDPFFRAAQAELDRTARLDFSTGARILPSGLGAAGPLLGAAAVGWRGLEGGPAAP